MSGPRPKRQTGTQKRPLLKCPYRDCTDGIVKGMFGSRSECATCNGSGLVDADSGEALPDREIIRQLLMRFEEQRLKIQQLEESRQWLENRLSRYERGR
ncbi:hypothetical protein [Endozoicomonas acroporae]|uniref:hypothetical protein n=1 Tax=Endozoicomonas acroporae TaxID=1701104 RepID=UPI0013D1F94C|nr:hypothetical protein [Endozoicomonas acroporae]